MPTKMKVTQKKYKVMARTGQNYWHLLFDEYDTPKKAKAAIKKMKLEDFDLAIIKIHNIIKKKEGEE